MVLVEYLGTVLGALLFSRRVFANGNQFARFIAALTGIQQADFGIAAKGKLLFLAIHPEFQSPEFAPSWSCEQVEPATVGKFIFFVPRFGGANLYVGKRHLGAFQRAR